MAVMRTHEAPSKDHANVCTTCRNSLQSLKRSQRMRINGIDTHKCKEIRGGHRIWGNTVNNMGRLLSELYTR